MNDCIWRARIALDSGSGCYDIILSDGGTDWASGQGGPLIRKDRRVCCSLLAGLDQDARGGGEKNEWDASAT
jgi:hypothetical protein